MLLAPPPVCAFGWQAADFALTDPVCTPLTLSDMMGARACVSALRRDRPFR